MHNLRFERVNLSLLLLDFFVDLSELVLHGLDDFLGDALLFLEARLARLTLLAPVLVLLGHAVDVVSDEVDALAEGVGALAQYLDGLLHELDVVLGEPVLPAVAAATAR